MSATLTVCPLYIVLSSVTDNQSPSHQNALSARNPMMDAGLAAGLRRFRMTGPSFLRAKRHTRGQDDDFGYAVRGMVTPGRHLSVTCLTSAETPPWCQHAPCRPRSAPFRAIVDGDAAALHRVVRGLCLTPVVSR